MPETKKRARGRALLISLKLKITSCRPSWQVPAWCRGAWVGVAARVRGITAVAAAVIRIAAIAAVAAIGVAAIAAIARVAAPAAIARVAAAPAAIARVAAAPRTAAPQLLPQPLLPPNQFHGPPPPPQKALALEVARMVAAPIRPASSSLRVSFIDNPSVLWFGSFLVRATPRVRPHPPPTPLGSRRVPSQSSRIQVAVSIC